jgi:FkbM family methyltransferase
MIEQILNMLPAFKGKQRLARSIFKNKIETARDIAIKGKNNCNYLVPNLKENIGFELFINGVYEPETIELILEKMPLHGTFLDIGANIGAICLPVCKRRTDINTIAIEASPKVYSYLKKNIQGNTIENCIIINKAVSDKDGQMVSFFSPDDLYGKGSMAAVFTNDSEEIETITIDTLLSNNTIGTVDFIKIDVEGFEYFAFKGAQKLLNATNAPDILFEFVDWAEELTKTCKPGDAQKLLFKYGYYLWQIGSNNTLTQINSPVTKGSFMIWASKKK